MLERAVAFGRGMAESEARHHAATFDADSLHAHADPREAVTNQVPVRHHPERRDVEAAGDVEPLDDHGAVGAGRVVRAVDDESRRELGARRCFDLPPTIGLEGRRRRVRGRGTGDDVLVYGVSDRREIESDREERRSAVELRPDRRLLLTHVPGRYRTMREQCCAGVGPLLQSCRHMAHHRQKPYRVRYGHS